MQIISQELSIPMYLLMTIGTGMGSDPADARNRLVQTASFIIKSYKPEHIIYFCSQESRRLVSGIEDACRDGRECIPPPSEICLITDPNDFNLCFEVIYGVCTLFQEFEVVIDASSGTRSMTLAATIASFLTHSQVSHVTGEKKGGFIVPGTEKMKEMSLYAAYDRLRFHEAVEQFNKSHFGTALDLISGLSSVPERDTYYSVFSAYYYWDKLNYADAYKYLRYATDLTGSIPLNRSFLNRLITLGEEEGTDLPKKERCRIKQEKYLYILVDLLNNARRRIDGERYDDALARLYRVVELLSQVLLLSWNIDDIEGKIHFTDLRKILPDRKDVSLYARRTDKKGVIRIGLRSKFMLLDDLGMQDAASYYLYLEPFLRIRNDSILAHGLSPVRGDRARQMWDEVHTIAMKACADLPFNLNTLLLQSAYPTLETAP